MPRDRPKKLGGKKGFLIAQSTGRESPGTLRGKGLGGGGREIPRGKWIFDLKRLCGEQLRGPKDGRRGV